MICLAAAMILLPPLAYALLQTNRVQSVMLSGLSSYVSGKLETKVSIGGVDFVSFRSIVFRDVLIHDLSGSSLVEMERLAFTLQSLSRQKRQLVLRSLLIENARFSACRLEGEADHNFRFLFEGLTSPGTQATGFSWQIHSESLQIRNLSLTIRDFNPGLGLPGFDPGNVTINGLYLGMRHLTFEQDSLSFELDYLRFSHEGGPDLDYLSGSFSFGHREALAANVSLRTPVTKLYFDLALRHGGPSALGDFFSGIDYRLSVGQSQLGMADIGYFYPPLNGSHDILGLQGIFEGKAGWLWGTQIDLRTGDHTRFLGDFSFSDLGNPYAAQLDFRVGELRSSVSEIRQWSLPDVWHEKVLGLPVYLDNVGHFSFSGKVEGSLAEFRTMGRLDNGFGTLTADAKFSKLPGDDQYTYSGMLEAGDLDLGRLLGHERVFGRISMSASLDGRGFSADAADIGLDGVITRFEVMGYEYQNLVLAGDFTDRSFNGSLEVDDPNLFLEFRGMADFAEAVPLFDFELMVGRARLSTLNLLRRDTLVESVISASMNMKASASSFDNMEGVVSLTGIRYGEIPAGEGALGLEEIRLETDTIYLRNTHWGGERRQLTIRSEFADVDLIGNTGFYRMGSIFRELVHDFLPALYQENANVQSRDDFSEELNFSLRLKDTDALSALFSPSIRISPDAWANGSYRSAGNELVVNAHADTLSLAFLKFAGWEVSGKRQGDRFLISSQSSNLMLSDSLQLDGFRWETAFHDDSIDLDIEWGQGEGSGHLSGQGKVIDWLQAEFFLSSFSARLNGSTWLANADHKIFLGQNQLEIYQLMFYNQDQFIRADGLLGSLPGYGMMLTFANFDLTSAGLFVGRRNMTFGGIASGYLNFNALYGRSRLEAEVEVSDFSFNDGHLGDLVFSSSWDPVRQGFLMDAGVTSQENGEVFRPLIVSGHVYNAERGQHLDLVIDLSDMKMSVWNTYLKGFADEFQGRAFGRLRLYGPTYDPELAGNVRLIDGGLYIPYLNTRYSFAHDVEIAKDRLRFDNMVMSDSLGNTALVSGYLMHNRFSDFSVDMRLQPRRLMVFNTTSGHNRFYYGTAFLSGLAHIHGPVNNLSMDVSARTNRGTLVFLPLRYAGEVRENHFITFVSSHPGQDGLAFEAPAPGGGIALNFDLEVTPDAEVQLLFDDRFGDIIRGRGSGDLRIGISPRGGVDMYGDYVIESGEYLFQLQNIINKRFRIEQGSNIRWTGDLNDADVDLRAAYRLRTPLYDLMLGQGTDMETAGMYRRRTPVETILKLEGKLFNPLIGFDIELPGGDENTRELIDRIITTEQEMNRQVFSLLVLNRFLPPNSEQYNTALGYGVGSTSSELLSNQLSNWLSQISTDFDIGINYRPGDDISSQEVELALATQLFDDRVIIEGNLGVAGNHTATGMPVQRASNIIGDVNVEVKITPGGKFRVKAFNRSNSFDVIHHNAPYTQGIGLFYRREFDGLYELFRRQFTGESAPWTEADPGTGAR